MKGNTDTEKFSNSKKVQRASVREKLRQISDSEIVVFTDGSALSNTGFTRRGALIYLNGYRTYYPIEKKLSVT